MILGVASSVVESGQDVLVCPKGEPGRGISRVVDPGPVEVGSGCFHACVRRGHRRDYDRWGGRMGVVILAA